MGCRGEGRGWPSRRWRAEDGADTGRDTFWTSAMASHSLSWSSYENSALA